MTSNITTPEASGHVATAAPPAAPAGRAQHPAASAQPQSSPAPVSPQGPRTARGPFGRIGFGRVLLTALHLVALGVLGSIVFAIALSLLTAGIATAFLLGLGLILLVALVYVLFGTGWFEIERANSLYRFGTASLELRRSEQPGFGGWLRSLGRQSIDGRMWAALLSFGIGALFGLLVTRLAMLFAWNLAIMIGGASAGTMMGPGRFFGTFGTGWGGFDTMQTFSSPWWSLLAAVLSLAGIIGLAALHAVIVRALLGSPTRVELAAEVRTKSAQHEGAMRASEVERTRIERDLHDGVQPRLVSIGMTLGLAQQKLDDDPATAKRLVAEAHTSTKAAITELRQLARGIHASVLDDRGLDAALSALAARSHVPVQLDVRMDGAPALRQAQGAAVQAQGEQPGSFRAAEAALYFSIAEALTNAAKHSRAAECRVTVRLRDAGTPQAALWARVEDNGLGGASVQPGGGLDGISNRVLAAGGTFRLDSPQGGPTTLEVSVPCAS